MDKLIANFAKASGLSVDEMAFIAEHLDSSPSMQKAFRDFCVRAKLTFSTEYAAALAEHRQQQRAEQAKRDAWFNAFQTAQDEERAEQVKVRQFYDQITATKLKLVDLPTETKWIADLCLSQGIMKEQWFTKRLILVKSDTYPNTICSRKAGALYDTYYRDFQ